MNLVLGVQHGHLCPALAHHQGAGGQNQGAVRTLEREVDRGIGAGHQQALGVVDPQLDQHRATAFIDRPGVCRHHRGPVLAGHVGAFKICPHARTDLRGIALRHIHIQAQAMGVGNGEQALARLRARIDQGTHIGVARRHHPIEWGQYALEGRQGLQTRKLGLGGLDPGLIGLQVATLFVNLLFGDRIMGQLGLPARCRHLGQVGVGTLGLELRLRPGHLGIQLGRVDLRQQLPSVHGCTDVHLPALEVAVDTCVHLRGVKGLQLTGQLQTVWLGVGLQ